MCVSEKGGKKERERERENQKSHVTSVSSTFDREVHSVCSWDEKASVKIQKALEQEILAFISDAQKVFRVHIFLVAL